jgi:hypothetical protein
MPQDKDLHVFRSGRTAQQSQSTDQSASHHVPEPQPHARDHPSQPAGQNPRSTSMHRVSGTHKGGVEHPVDVEQPDRSRAECGHATSSRDVGPEAGEHLGGESRPA